MCWKDAFYSALNGVLSVSMLYIGKWLKLVLWTQNGTNVIRNLFLWLIMLYRMTINI